MSKRIPFELNRGLEPLNRSVTFQFATWDIEAQNWWDLALVGVWDGEVYRHFRSVPEFIEYILQSKYHGYRFFAHFGGRYDMNFIFDWLKYHPEIGCSFYCSGSLVIQMTLTYRKIKVKLCDSYRLFYMPGNDSQTRTTNKSGLASLTKAFGVKHQKQEYDFKQMEYGRELISYNEFDCRGLYEVIERFFEETGVMSETFATHALRVWRKDFLKETIWKPRPDVLDLARATYHGGRVEVFKRYASACWAYDVNSMYPYVMQFAMPTEFVGESHRLTDSHYGFVDAEVVVPENYIPCLPVRAEKLYFPVGRFRGQWTSEELIQAESLGCKIQKIFQAFYFRTKEIFREYVEKLYALKKTASEPTRTIAKGLLNALYGKFGQNPTKKIYCLVRQAPEGSFPILYPNGEPSGFAYYERTSRSNYLLPHLASAVTSKARLHLLSKLNNDSYYCDTDSVFTTKPFPVSKELGDWGEVGQGEATFIQPKLYKFKGTWKSKGLNREQSIDEFIQGSPNRALRSRSIREAMRDGKDACGHVEVQKVLRETRPKRAWLADGQETRPWDVQELGIV
jgi:hypothetical protein